MLPSFNHCLLTMKPSPQAQSILLTVSYFTSLLPLSQVQQTISVLSEETPNDPNLVEFQGGISLDEYGYASDSDLDEEEGKEELNKIVQDSRCLHLCWKGIILCGSFEDEKFELRANASAEQMPQTPMINGKEVRCGTVPSRRVLVTDTAYKTCASLA
jgi:hypothetical protein